MQPMLRIVGVLGTLWLICLNTTNNGALCTSGLHTVRDGAGDVALQRPSHRPRCCRPCEMEPRSTRAVDPGNQVVCWERATLMPCVCTIAAPASLTSLTGVAVP